MGTRRFADLRATQVGELLSERSVLVQPVGSLEQHGGHLPLATDLVIAASTAEAAVDRRGEELDLWLLPPIAYSKSNEHAWAPGTIWLSPATLLAVLDDLGRSVATLPTRRLVFVNGHGGNTSILDVACRELRLHHDLLAFLIHPEIPPDHGGESPEQELAMGVHGGLNETSMMLHLRPELVSMDHVARAVPEHLAENRHVSFSGDVRFGWVSNDFGPSGIIGDPTDATATRGLRLFEDAVANLASALEEIARFELPRSR